MRRRDFLQFAGTVSVLLGGTQLAGCLGESDSPQTVASGSRGFGSLMPTAPAAQSPQGAPAPAQQPAPTQQQPTPDGPSAMAQGTGPVWTPAPTIEFVEGVPAVVSVRDFVRDPDSDPLVITLKSGTLIPGLSWDPTKATITYDGRALGATEDAPIIVSGLTFNADDQK